MRVSYQGTAGAFSEEAIRRYFSNDEKVTCIGFNTFAEAAKAVSQGQAHFAMLPIENTTAGSINRTYDVLGTANLHIVGEQIIRINHCLLSTKEATLKSIKTIISHPQALAQCSQFLASLDHSKAMAFTDTAMAARKVRDDATPTLAAIAGEHAAQLYGLHILKRDIANQAENFTRFVVVGPKAGTVHADQDCKTSLLITTSHEKGALMACLKVLDAHGINMVKLESRPKPREPWQYLFYIDLEANTELQSTRSALAELRQAAHSVKVLGCYTKQQQHLKL